MTTREEQKEATRRRIIGAVAELVAEAHPAAISVPAVAARAGVGVATVYRYFPTKEALLDASAMVLGDDAELRSLDEYPRTWEGLRAALPAQFAAIARQIDLARNQLASPLGRQLRQVRWVAKKAVVDAGLTEIGVDPRSPEGERLAAVADVLTSSTAVLELHDKAGIPIEDASNYVLWAVDVLAQATVRELTGKDRARR